ncbi:hypothetical protein P691DRAFT_773738 [Macrolepiota fuliginosa MF-IS2]|uniref:Uncharacterized protein n=1 Tax=Macrolepiota fuliginosa MF-IS2 TaxID=1400762 RepID=A0A9P6C6T7_9AGAR|nr:hypothetical protein P691DRAFT_773738 [Macrolepiota fuliginosa MF-IS2]
MFFLLYTVLWFTSTPGLSLPTIPSLDQGCDVAINSACYEYSPASFSPTRTPTPTFLPPQAPTTITSPDLLVGTLPLPSSAPSPPRLVKRNETNTGTSTDAPTQQCTMISPDPDIAGIGIRVSFYATALMALFFPATESTTSTLVVFGFGLVIAMIVQTARRTLSRYHSMIIRTYLTSSVQVLMASPVPLAQRTQSWAQSLFYIFLLSKTLCLIFNYSGIDGGGPNPECNPLFERPIFPFVTLAISDRDRRVASILLELVYTTATVIVRRVPVRYQESLNRFRSSYLGKILYMMAGVIPAVITIESWILRHRNLVGDGENNMTAGQIIAIVALYSVGRDVVTELNLKPRRWVGKWLSRTESKHQKVE